MDDFKELSTYKGWDWDVYMIRLTICMYQKKEKEKKRLHLISIYASK